MRLSQVLLRKRKMRHKPQSFVRNMIWNNHYYLQQEQPVANLKFKETMEENNIPVMKIDDVLTSFMPPTKTVHIEDPIEKQQVTRDQSHPFWNDEPAFTYRDQTWMPKDQELKFAQAATNTVAVDSLPPSLINSLQNSSVKDDASARIEGLLRSCYIGDATQRKLPRNFEVPFIGWHPVESKMNPRNQYDWKAMSWGWNARREYGIPNSRKITNLNRGLFKEICKNRGINSSDFELIENSKMRQFITRPDGKLTRYWLSFPLTLSSRTPLPLLPPPTKSSREAPSSPPVPMSASSPPLPVSDEDLVVPDMYPMDPLGAYFQDYIYEKKNNFPIQSAKFSHPHIHTVFYHNTRHIRPRYNLDKERSKCLIHGYTAALGQARLLQGENVSSLKTPIRINCISTNGQKFTFSTFQLNSLDFDPNKPNYFYYSPEEFQLFDECGYNEEGVVSLQGLNMEVYKMMETLIIN